LLFAFLVALATMPLDRGAAAEADKASAVGDNYVISLQGNPSTGYRWRLDRTRSQNLALVKVEDLGYAAAKQTGKPMVGAAATYHFRVTLLATGTANLAFEYVRPWEGKPIRTFAQRVEIKSR
jgi:inhibitor of cysteine peptidase